MLWLRDAHFRAYTDISAADHGGAGSFTLTSAEQSVHKGFMQRIPTRARLNRHLVRHLLKTYFLVTLVGFLVLLP